MTTITAGEFVLVKQDKHLKSISVMRNKKVWMERSKFTMDGAIGCLCGTSFEIKQGSLVKVERHCEATDIEKDENEDGVRDNRDLVDSSDNQKMTMTEIKELRNSGVSGKDIIEQLVEHSATFKRKSEFAQEKYIKKKKKKYAPVFTILKPNTRLMIEMYWNKGPSKICHLRMDALSQLLSYSNVRATNRMLVVETCVGLVTGAVMERLGGIGSIINIHSGSSSCRTAYEWFNFPAEYSENIYDYPMTEIHQLGKSGSRVSEPVLASQSPSATSIITQDSLTDNVKDNNEISNPPEETPSISVSDNGDGQQKCLSYDERKEKKRMKIEKFLNVKHLIENADLDGLIVVTKFHPTPLVLKLIEFLAPGRPFAVFCLHREPLLDCYVKLRDNAHIVALKLTETWLRDYQVLSNRTHPVINMSGCGGYILTGITVGN